MTKSSLTEAIAVASSTPRDAALTPKRLSVLAWISERGVFVFTALLILFAVVFVNGFASL
jgi:ribose transport system permease protein